MPYDQRVFVIPDELQPDPSPFGIIEKALWQHCRRA